MIRLLRQIDEYEFEHFVAELWEQHEWKTTVSQASNDRGVDVIANKADPVPQKHLIQAKRYGSNTNVGVREIREYSSLYNRENIDAVIIVTTGSFTTQAQKEAEDLNVKLVDGETLCGIITQTGAENIVREYTNSACPHCEITVQDETTLHEHLCEAHGYIECSYCEDIIQDESTLREHLYEEHGHKGCSYCMETFQNESALRDHLCRDHDHSECSYCGNLFQNEYAIRKHFSKKHDRSELSRIDQKRVDLYQESSDVGE